MPLHKETTNDAPAHPAPQGAHAPDRPATPIQPNAADHTAPPVAQASSLPDIAATPGRPNETSLVLTVLRREQGATLAELVAATGWLPHTTRAALTGLRKKGHVLDKSKRDDITCYRVGDA